MRVRVGGDHHGSAESVSAGRSVERNPLRLKQDGARRLVAETGAYRDAPASDGAPAAQHCGSALGLHAGAEPVSLDALAAIRLKCALGHENALLYPL